MKTTNLHKRNYTFTDAGFWKTMAQADIVTTCLLKTEQSRGLNNRHNTMLLDFYLCVVS